MIASVNVNAKKAMKASEFREKMNAHELDPELNTMFRSLRSHSEYWVERKSEIKTIIKYYGPPTWFLTFNPAEKEWKELRDTYVAVYQHLNNEEMTTHAFTVMDSAIFVRHFSQRVNAIYKHALMGKDGIFGNGIHFWRRTEYQLRGAPHCHGFLWVSGAPTMKDSSEEEIIRYIDSKITTRIPSSTQEPELHRLVKSYQMHVCLEPTCVIKKKIQGKTVERCRFNFPFEAQKRTTLRNKEDDLSAEDLLKTIKDVQLRRAPG